MNYDLDIIVPVFREEGNILKTINEIFKRLKINFRLLVIYDYEDDPTVSVVKENFKENNIVCLRNKYVGFNGAIKTGFENIQAGAALLYPADDHVNFDLIYKMYEKYKEGFDIVCASRFKEGGSYEGAPFLKRLIVKSVCFTLSNLTTLPTKDATNGFRLFSKNVIEKFPIRSKKGFTFSIELLAKAYGKNFKITELPEKWPVRTSGKSKFKYLTIPYYLPWYFYIFFISIKKK